MTSSMPHSSAASLIRVEASSTSSALVALTLYTHYLALQVVALHAVIAAMLLGFLAMTLVYAWLMVHRVRLARLDEARESSTLADAIEERRREAETLTIT